MYVWYGAYVCMRVRMYVVYVFIICKCLSIVGFVCMSCTHIMLWVYVRSVKYVPFCYPWMLHAVCMNVMCDMCVLYARYVCMLIMYVCVGISVRYICYVGLYVCMFWMYVMYCNFMSVCARILCALCRVCKYVCMSLLLIM